MKKLLYLLPFLVIACSPDNEDVLLDEQASPVNLQTKSSTESTNYEDSGSLIYVETFENPELKNDPQAGDFYLEHAKDHSFQIEEDIIRNGSRSGRFQIRKNDPKIWGGNRTEMSQAQNTTQSEAWYGFSQYFPESYIYDSSAEVIGQWHVQADEGEATNRSPSNALIASEGRIKWMARWDKDRIMDDGYSDGLEYLDLGPIPQGKWIDWVVHIKYSHTNTGVLEVWKNGKKVINRQNMPNTYNDEKYPYLKFGVYKWDWGNNATQRTIYYDEVKIGNRNSSYDEVKTNSNNANSEINMMVNSYTVDCYGEMAGTCLLVQEGDKIGSEDWEYFYYKNSIEGFNYEPGYIYGLKVNKVEVSNQMSDSSSIKYELDKVISKTKQ